MQYLFALLPFALSALAIAPEAQPSPVIEKPGGPPPGCSSSYSGTFGLSTVYLPGEAPVTSAAHRKRTPPQEGPASPLSSTVEDGVLRDSTGRFGYIASNQQYQYDNPIQAGAIWTTGWSVCPNNTLALGPTTVFYQCISGNFYNLYDKPVRTGCIAINLQIVPNGGTASSYAAPTSSATSYSASSATPVTSPVPATTPSATTPVSSYTPTTSKPAPPSTTSQAPPPPSSAPASSKPSYTGAANPLVALEGSFFAAMFGAAAVALI